MSDVELETGRLVERLCGGKRLDRDETRRAFLGIVRGEVDPVEIAALLIALKSNGGESPLEIAGAAEALRANALPFPAVEGGCADSCGTGGDGAHTLHISTAAAQLAAEAGLKIDKHGNRSVSSRCGSADVLELCGVRVDAPVDVSHAAVERERICFLFAPQYHAGVRHAMPVRRALGLRTIFNLLGPLANPAAPQYQLLGVYDPELCRTLAETLGVLGCRSALVVHGAGLDELALHAPSRAAWWREGAVEELELDPAGLGLARRSIEELAGAGPEENARLLRNLLGGRGAPAHREATAHNAGALLWISGRAADLRAGVESCLEILEIDAALGRLERWAEMTRSAESGDANPGSG